MLLNKELCLVLDKPLLNGRIYRTSEVQEAIDKCKETLNNRRLFVTFDKQEIFLGHGGNENFNIDLSSIMGTVETLWIDSNKVYCDLNINEKLPLGACAIELIKAIRYGFAISSLGYINDKHEIYDMKINHIRMMMLDERTF